MNGNIRENFSTIDWEALLLGIGFKALQLISLLVIFFIIKSLSERLIRTAFRKYEQNKEISAGRALTLKSLISNMVSYIIIFIFVVTVLQVFGIEVTAILAGAGIVGLAVGFGAQGLVSDVVTGFFLLLEKQIDVGDFVTTGNFSGIVEAVGLRTTQIRGFDGTLHYVPNRNITTLSNHSRGNMRALVDITIPVEKEIDEMISVIQEACQKVALHESTIVEGPNVLGVESLGTSDYVIRVICKTKNMEQWAVERKLRKVIKEALEEKKQEKENDAI
ncbi:MAG TPA: mechanosensitive ion channel family protein [Chondromyces sp.]|nr:mechanosensitive ion channel family protein [Chondromyces sp.]